jgi:START domain
VNNSRVVENYNINSPHTNQLESHSSDGDNENSSDDNGEKIVKIVNEKLLKKSASDVAINENHQENGKINQLSKSLGATDINGAADINNVASEDDELFSDAQQEIPNGIDHSKSVFVNAAMSVDYVHCPPTTKYIRGDNIVSCWAMRPVEGDEDSCIFEWLLCIDLKGSLPKYVLNTVRDDLNLFQQ